jgi:hypothetical protein
MGQVSKQFEKAREETEGDLCILGNTLILLGMIDDRMLSACLLGADGILRPAREDIRRVRGMIRKVQNNIRARAVSAGGGS